MSAASFFLLLFILNLAITFGACIYEARIVLPLWFSRQPDGIIIIDEVAMYKTDPGRRFWAFVTTLPLTLLTIANLIYATREYAPGHAAWLVGTLIILIERVATFAFFIPAVIAMQTNNKLSADRKSDMAKRWLRLNYLRNALTLAGLVFCVIAFV